MTKKLLFAFSILLVAALVATAADVSGKWVYEQPGFRGGEPVQVTITLKAEGSNLTGNISRPGRGGEMMETPISEGKVDGDNVSFKVTRDTPRGTFTSEYSGTVSGDEMKLKVSMPGREGNARTREFTAKRASS